MFVEIGGLLLTCFLLFYNYVQKTLKYWKKVGISHLYPYPVIGNCLQVILRRKSLPEFFIDVHRSTKEKLLGINLYTTPVILVKDPDLIQDVTIKHFDHFVNHSSFFLDLSAFPDLCNNFFNIKDDHWRNSRSVLSGSFTNAKLRQTAPLIEEIYQNCKEYLTNLIEISNNGVGEIQLRPMIGRLTCDVIVNTSFGVSINSFKKGKDNIIHDMINRTAVMKNWKIALNNLFGSRFLKFFKITLLDTESTNFLADMLKNAYKNRRETNFKRLDMVDILLEAQKNSIEKNKQDKSVRVLTECDLISESFLFFFAGYDTVLIAMSFTLLELSLNPDVQQKLHEELMSICEDDKFHLDQLISLKYLNCVIQESIRKWPPIPSTDRVCTKDYSTIVDGKPVTIKAGSLLMLSIIGNHRDPKNYLDPEKFDPERFSDETSKQRHPCTALAFGAGPRNCIGMKFAMLELKIIIANVLKDFELVPTKNTIAPIQLDPMSFQTIPYKGVVGVKKRAI